MRKILFFLLISVGISAQFNYQAIVKDNNGEILTNNQVKIKFSISYQSTSVSPVFIEEHTLTTPADGVINISVGNGTIIDGSFSNIDWSNDVFMKEELDTGNGYQDMGTKQFASVPLAQFANQVYGLSIYENIDANNQITSPDTIELGFSDSNLIIKSELISATNINITNSVSATEVISPYIFADTVTSSNIDVYTLTSSQITAETVTTTSIDVYYLLTSSNIIADSISSTTLLANTISSTSLDVYSLTSSNITADTVTASYFIGDGSRLTNMSYGNSVGLDTNGNLLLVDQESNVASSQGNNNIAIGLNAGKNVNSDANVFIGNHAGNLTTTGRENIAIGANAFQNNTEGRNNTLVGGGVGSNIDGGSYNAIYGDQSGLNVTTSSNLTLIGTGADIASSEQLQNPSQIQNSTAIGANAIVTTSNTIQLGNQGVTFVNTSGTISATAFIGDGSGLTNIGDSIGIDSNGNLLIVDSYPSLTVSQVDNVLLGAGVGSNLTDGYQNIGIGSSALASATLTSNNVALGSLTLSKASDADSGMNIAIGNSALENIEDGYVNIAIGTTAMQEVEEGRLNIAIGAGALEDSKFSSRSVAIGVDALNDMNISGPATITLEGGFEYPSGVGNTAIGDGSMKRATGGSYNTAVGQGSLANNTTGINNVALGSYALNKSKTGQTNLAVGWGALMNTENGQGNTAVGGHAGQFAGNDSHDNTYIGAFTGTVSNLLIENSTVIGANATVSTSNTIQLGDGDIELVNTSGVVSASGFVGDGSGLTNITGSVDIDSSGNLMIVDVEPSLNGLKNNILLGSGVAPQLSGSTTDTQLGSDNIAIGTSSMASVTTAFFNIAIGSESLSNITSATTYNNTAIGIQSLLSLKRGNANVAIGNFAMQEGDDFSFNTAIGSGAMQLGKKGIQNVAIGPGALLRIGQTVTETIGYVEDENGNNVWNPIATSNVAVGRYSMYKTDSGYKNVAVGRSSLLENKHGYENVGIGDSALYQNKSNFNTGVGRGALYSNKQGIENTSVGYASGTELNSPLDENDQSLDGSFNTFIGASANTVSGVLIDNSTAIGAYATVTTSNTIQLGDLDIELVNTSGVVSASGFVGDGSGLQNVNLSGVIDQNGNLMILDIEPTLTTSQTHNILLGAGVAPNLTDGFNNIGIGGSALASATTTFDNVAIGPYTLSSVSSNSSGLNIAVGNSALKSLENGAYNVAIGAGAIEDATMTERNVAIGVDALYGGDKNWNSVAIGYEALLNIRSVIDEGDASLEEIVQNSGNPSTTLDEMAYGFPGNVAIGTGAFASPQTSTATYTEVSMGNIAIGHMPMYNATKATNENIAIGTFSLAELEDGGGNISIGRESMSQLNVGSGNIAIGRNSMREGEDIRNSIAIGEYSMIKAEQSRQNTAVGASSLRIIGSELTEDIGWVKDENGNDIWNPIATSNVAVGTYSMNNTKSGYQNVAVGRSSLLYNNEGFDNVAVGDRALRDNNASYNTGLGRHALEQNINGNYNTSVGYFSGGQLNTSGVSPTIGGNNNTFIGAFADTVSGVLIENSTAIGAGAIVTSSNTIQLGANNTALVNTSGIVSATAFYGDGSGLTNVGGSSEIDSNGNLIVVDVDPTLTPSQTHNILVGAGVAPNLTNGYNNIGIGGSALASATTTFDNVAIGPYALSSASSNSSALNIAVGHSALKSMENGWVNVGIGTTALANLESGSGNIAFGAGATEDVTRGKDNIAIGVDALHQGNVNTNSIAIGKNALFNVDSDFIDPETNDYIIMTDNPSTTLDESLYGMPGNIALGTGSFASPAQQTPQSGTASFSGGNISLGHMAMYNASKFAWDNIALGTFTLANLNAGEWGNVAIGWGSQHSLEDGAMNIAIGVNTMRNTTDGDSNLAIGNRSMNNANHLYYNTAIGFQSLRDMNINAETNGTVTMTTVDGLDYQSGISNTALGAWAMRRATGGSDNTAIGDSSLIQLENGIQNVAVGVDALKWTKQTSYNVAVGVQAMENLTGTATYTDDNNVVQFLNSSGNTAIGTRAMQNANYGSHNVAIGDNALLSNSAFENVAVGSFSMSKNNTGDSNVAVGTKALYENIDGDRNTATGERSLEYNTYGSRNTAFGHHSSGYNTVGNFNTSLGIAAARDAENIDGAVAVGYHAMTSMTNDPNSYADNTKSENTAVGYFAMSGDENIVNTGVANTALGYLTLTNLSSGNYNTAIGSHALYSNVEGISNIGIGWNALNSNVGTGDFIDGNVTWKHGSFNIALGNKALSNNVSGSFNVAIGDSAGEKISASWNNTTVGNYSLAKNTNGSDNTAVGSQALSSQTDDTYENVGIGAHALQNNDAGGANVSVGTWSLYDANFVYNTVAIGQESGKNLDTDGSANNTFIGKHTGTVSGLELHNSTVIGSDAIVSSNHTMVFGDQDVNKWAFGLATTDSGKVIQVGDDSTNGNGAYLTAGGTWTNGSSILFKTNFIDLSSEWILDKISKLNIRKWDYKNTNETHIGPTSEEFIDLFGVGIDNENSHISTIDVSGVALRGLQALIDENKVQKEQLENQNNIINDLYNRILALEKKISE